MKERIFSAFRALGFELEEVGESGYYLFHYEGHNFLYLYDENDEEFLCLALPGVMEFDEENANQIYCLMDKLNGTVKYVKANLIHGDVWLSYEREIITDENLEDVISHMVMHLYRSLTILLTPEKEEK